MTPASNLIASIHQRILNKAAIEQRPFSELLQYYANERFLYRLGQSSYRDQFILKGALVFLAWKIPFARPTRDIDFLGFTENSIENLIRIVREISSIPVERDALFFDPESVKGEMIKEDADYTGIRVEFVGLLGKSKIKMRLDIAFTDVVTPAASELELPTILDGSTRPCIRAYPPETVIAEKFQTMVALGMVNSRMKDLYDLWYMTNSFKFNFEILSEAISRTFNKRKTILPKQVPDALTSEFSTQKQTQWAGFLQKNRIHDAPTDFSEVINRLIYFFDPIIRVNEPQSLLWIPNEGWRKS